MQTLFRVLRWPLLVDGMRQGDHLNANLPEASLNYLSR